MSGEDDSVLPLAGVRVLDLTAIVLGPLATLCLADLGAEVVKLEGPAGDSIRHSGAVPVAGMGSIYLALNRNKKSVVLDLKSPEAKEVLDRLIGWADVVVHNMRPKSARALGVDYEALKARNPRLIYCSASGFAPTSSRADDPAVDDVIQASAGLAALFAETGDAPRYVPTILADKVCGLLMSQAVLAGLFRRERTGRGMAVNIPMYETMAAFNLLEHMGQASFRDAPGAPGYGRLLTPHRRPIETRDGYIAMTPYTLRDWQGFLRAAGRADLAESPLVTDPARRNAEIGALYAQLAEILKERDTGEWIAIARKVAIPVAAVRSLEETIADGDLKAAGYLVDYDHPDVGRLSGPAALVRSEDGATAPVRPAPRLGQDTADMLRAIGYSEEDVNRLRESGVAGVA